MSINSPLGIAGNVIALLTLSLKTIYDLYLNPKQFQKEFNHLNPINAAERKRDRADKTTGFTWLFLAISHIIFIMEAIG